MKKLAIYGFGGHAREVASLIGEPCTFFVDDEYYTFGEALPISTFNPDTHKMMVAVADSADRKKMVEKLPSDTEFFTYVHPSAIICDAQIGEGSYVGPYSIITTNIRIGKHAIINRGNQIGHDTIARDYLSMMPSAVIGGNVEIGECVYFGSCSNVREKIVIASDVVIGMNAAVVKNIKDAGTYVGVPAKKVEYENK